MAEARAGTGLSSAADPRLAAAEACIAAMAHLNALRPGRGCDVALIFAAGPAAAAPERLAQAVQEASGARMVVGATADRVFANGAGSGGVAVMLTRGTAAEVAVVREVSRDPAGAARSLARTFCRNAGLLGAGDQVLLLLADPRRFEARSFLGTLAEELPPPTPVMGGASGLVGGRASIFPEPLSQPGPRIGAAEDTAAGLVLRGARAVVGLSQGCQPVAGPYRVTQVKNHLLRTLDDRPAQVVLADALPTWLVEDLPRLGRDVFLGRSAGGPGGRTHFHYLPITGVESGTGGLRVGGLLRRGDALWITLRDPDRARHDLREMLEQLRRRLPATPGFGLYVEDADRGGALHGRPDVDIGLVHEAFPDLPVVGWRSPFAVTTLEGAPTLVNHAAALALFW